MLGGLFGQPYCWGVVIAGYLIKITPANQKSYISAERCPDRDTAGRQRPRTCVTNSLASGYTWPSALALRREEERQGLRAPQK